MGFWQKWMPVWAFERKYGTLDLFRDIYGSRESRSGVAVDYKTALQVTAVLACCKVIAEGVAQIPYRVYTSDGNKPAPDHPLHRILFRQPNGWQTSFEFRETIIFHAALGGNAFVFVNRAGPSRNVVELIPIEPGRVTVEQNEDYSITYKVRGKNGTEQEFPEESIWHIRGPSWNTWMGMECIGLAREAIGLAISTEQTHSDFHKNGAQSSGVLSVPDPLEGDQYKKLKAWVDTNLTGDAKHSPLIVDRGTTWLQTQMTGVDAQHIETRKFQIEEVCRAFRVNPIMVMQSDKAATYASAEQMFIAHVVHTLAPWYERLEQSADINLLSEADQRKFYTKFTPNALMRGAAKDRAEFYSRALGSGGSEPWMEVNEVRALEELEPVEWGTGRPLGQSATAAMTNGDSENG